MRSASVTARHEGRFCSTNPKQRGDNVFFSGDFCRIRICADQHKVVVHDIEAPDGETLGEKLFFKLTCMHEHHVGIAAPSHVERLPGALSDHAHLYPGFFLEQRQNVPE